MIAHSDVVRFYQGLGGCASVCPPCCIPYVCWACTFAFILLYYGLSNPCFIALIRRGRVVVLWCQRYSALAVYYRCVRHRISNALRCKSGVLKPRAGVVVHAELFISAVVITYVSRAGLVIPIDLFKTALVIAYVRWVRRL